MTREELRHKYATKLKATTSGTRISQLLLEYERELEKISLPPAEGAEAYLRKHPFLLGETEDGEDYLSTDDIELIKQLAPMFEDFATLHAQRIAERMVEEKLKKEYERGIEDGKIIDKHGSVSYIE